MTESGRGEIKYKGLLEIEKPKKAGALEKVWKQTAIKIYTNIITKLQHLLEEDKIQIKTNLNPIVHTQ